MKTLAFIFSGVYIILVEIIIEYIGYLDNNSYFTGFIVALLLLPLWWGFYLFICNFYETKQEKPTLTN